MCLFQNNTINGIYYDNTLNSKLFKHSKFINKSSLKKIHFKKLLSIRIEIFKNENEKSKNF